MGTLGYGSHLAAICRLKKLGGQEVAITPTDNCKFPTEDMGAQNFHFVPNFNQNGDFQPQMLFFGRKFSDKKEIVRHTKTASPYPLQRCH